MVTDVQDSDEGMSRATENSLSPSLWGRRRAAAGGLKLISAACICSLIFLFIYFFGQYSRLEAIDERENLNN